MSGAARTIPDWDLEQLEVILEPASSWQVVVAPPGAGKSAVACQRVASLVDDGVSPDRILLISFTRAAVKELHDRIVKYAVAGDKARNVRLSTIDSQAWQLRSGAGDDPITKNGYGSYECNIERANTLLAERDEFLLEFLENLEHVVIDEAQDIVGPRAELLVEILSQLSDDCGVTVLADPNQAIYGFTSDGWDQGDEGVTFLSLLSERTERTIINRAIAGVYRVTQPKLRAAFDDTRDALNQVTDPEKYPESVTRAISGAAGDPGCGESYDEIAEFIREVDSAETLVLFRRRVDVLAASSYCSNKGISHRLRFSAAPAVIKPWIGWIFSELARQIVTYDEFVDLWDERKQLAAAPFEGEDREAAWELLHRFAAGRRGQTIDLRGLRGGLARSRPPIEFCEPEVGRVGPILGTIHASKGREAETVLLALPANGRRQYRTSSAPAMFEEGRVFYVGATRAREALWATKSPQLNAGYLESGRVFRNIDKTTVQLEYGRAGDVERAAHLSWDNAAEVQSFLACHASSQLTVSTRAAQENGYMPRLEAALTITEDGVTRYGEIGQLSRDFNADLHAVWKRVDRGGNLRPAPKVPYVYFVGSATVALTDDECMGLGRPHGQSGFGLAPVVKGFAPVSFIPRKKKRAL